MARSSSLVMVSKQKRHSYSSVRFSDSIPDTCIIVVDKIPSGMGKALMVSILVSDSIPKGDNVVG